MKMSSIYLCFLRCRYRFLELEESTRLPSGVECGYAKGVVVGGLSKAFAAPGLRIGWLLSRDRNLLDRVEELHDYTTICNSAPSEVAL